MPPTRPLRGRAGARWALLCLAVLLALCAGHALAGFDAGPLSGLLEKWGYNVVLVGSGALCLARGAIVRGERTAWLIAGAGVLGWSMGNVYYTAVLWDLDPIPIPVPERRAVDRLLPDRLRRGGAAAARPRGPFPRGPVGRRRARRACGRRTVRRRRIPERARHDRRPAGRGGHQPGLSPRRPDPARHGDRRHRPHRLEARPHVGRAGGLVPPLRRQR